MAWCAAVCAGFRVVVMSDRAVLVVGLVIPPASEIVVVVVVFEAIVWRLNCIYCDRVCLHFLHSMGWDIAPVVGIVPAVIFCVAKNLAEFAVWSIRHT